MAINAATKRKLEDLRERGFDRSMPSRGGYVRVSCSQCEALVINGVACHENGCPNHFTHKMDEEGDDE